MGSEAPSSVSHDWPVHRRETFQGFVKTTYTEAASERATGMVRVFRGQSDASWSLRPRILRELDELHRAKAVKPTAQGTLTLEEETRRWFARAAHVHVDRRFWAQDLPLVDQWALMAHYGAPTRLVDWTLSPLVALYFAVREQMTVDGAVWVLNTAQYEKTRAGKAANYEEDSDLRAAFAGDLPSRAKPQAKLLYREDPKGDRLYFVKSSVQTNRMLAQQSVFTVVDDPSIDHADVVARACEKKNVTTKTQTFFYKIVIPSSCKFEILDDLARANVTAAALFPGLDGLGRETTDHLRLTMGTAQATLP